MIFIDSNVPIYLVGAPHPNKDRLTALLPRLVRHGESFATSVEVYQELLHYYGHRRRLHAVDAALASLDGLADRVLAFGTHEVRVARDLLRDVPALSARDALHVAVMRTAGIERILSFDGRFDACPGILRLH